MGTADYVSPSAENCDLTA